MLSWGEWDGTGAWGEPLKGGGLVNIAPTKFLGIFERNAHMYCMNPEIGGPEFENLRFVVGESEGEAVEFEFAVECVRLVIGDDGRVLEIKLMGVEKEVVDEMGIRE